MLRTYDAEIIQKCSFDEREIREATLDVLYDKVYIEPEDIVYEVIEQILIWSGMMYDNLNAVTFAANNPELYNGVITIINEVLADEAI